ncbi:MAG: DNA polymerase III subunit delta' [Actinomycetaceae bacterium]|nr:DNA polymerase III subunit delta' [Arcanobacterium sp.]MDD7505636.1 DNA polymerase III subunit delta' [Actinomycetaceae bacterium]MDY6143420.1 DNA polymerase III subunit delta' [Arcanobacterium sp.]
MSVFDELVGQSAVVAELKRAAEAARAANLGREADVSSDAGAPRHAQAARSGNAGQETHTGLSSAAMSHAWLFTGPPGSGRSTAARALAASLLCTGEVPGCGECSACKAVMEANHPDVSSLSTDLVSITIAQVRELVAKSYLAPSSGAYRVFIIEDADRMVVNTTNVLLKAIEEPAESTVWMLCTANVADVLPTIRSRCRNVNLVTPSVEDVAARLVETDAVDPDQALIAARVAQSHIGVARALATDPEAAELRRNTLGLVGRIEGVGDAVLAAGALLDPEYMYGRSSEAQDAKAADKAAQKAADEQAKAEEERLAQAMGLEADAKIPKLVRDQAGFSAEDMRRRKTRTQRDRLDRELLYIASYFRDVLIVHSQATVDLINEDFRDSIENAASMISQQDTIGIMDALDAARTRIAANVAPQLALEAALITIVEAKAH